MLTIRLLVLRLSGLVLVFCFLTVSCTEPSPTKEPPAKAQTISTMETPETLSDDSTEEVALGEQEDYEARRLSKYDLNTPDLSYNLPKALLEISALTYDEKSQSLLAVNDERADIFRLDAGDGQVKEQYDFGKKGDYEGIEIVDDVVYVLKSNGNIYPFDWQSKIAGDPYKTALSAANDVEGLGYDSKRKELILACKGAPNLEKQPKLKKTKAFYAFSLKSKKLTAKPKFVIEDKKLEAHFEKKMQTNVSKKESKKLRKRLQSFSPSAIAKHPKDKHYYILSSVGKLMVICNKKGKIKDVHFLDDNLFSQPEGICFAPDGTMYISNEGRSLVAKILTFNIR